MEIANVIRTELEKLKTREKPRIHLEDVLAKFKPTNRECAAIPCAYLGLSADIEKNLYCKPKKRECAAIPCIYLG